MKKRIIMFLIALVFLCVLLIAFDVRLKTVTYSVESPKITDKIKLALVTDLHSCHYGKNQGILLEKIEKYKPDAVLLCGDIFDDIRDNYDANIIIDELTEDYKVYYVSGNHEWWSGKMEEMFDYLSLHKVTVLRGNVAELEIGRDTIYISGIDDPEVNKYDPSYTTWEEQLENVGKNIQKDEFNLFLSHRPERAEKYFEYSFDAVVSGHAHGGQFRIPYVINGLYAPNQGFFPKLAGGIYDYNGGKLVVSRGLARESTRLPRVFNRPELVFVNLIPEE